MLFQPTTSTPLKVRPIAVVSPFTSPIGAAEPPSPLPPTPQGQNVSWTASEIEAGANAIMRVSSFYFIFLFECTKFGFSTYSLFCSQNLFDDDDTSEVSLDNIEVQPLSPLLTPEEESWLWEDVLNNVSFISFSFIVKQCYHMTNYFVFVTVGWNRGMLSAWVAANPSASQEACK